MSRNLVKNLIMLSIILAAPLTLAATGSEDGGQVGQTLNWGTVVAKEVIGLACLIFGGWGMYIAVVPLLKRGASEMQPGGGAPIPWAKSLFLGIFAIGLVSGGIAMILKSSHVTDNATGVQIQTIKDS